MPYSLHRLLNINEYHPLQYVLCPGERRKWDQDLFRKGEKPDAYADVPINIMDYESVDLFNWQDEAKDMLSTLDFVRRVDVQAETIDRYIREGKIKPDLVVPISENRFFNYFTEDTIKKYAQEFGWDLITASNLKQKFSKRSIHSGSLMFSAEVFLITGIICCFSAVLANVIFSISSVFYHFKSLY